MFLPLVKHFVCVNSHAETDQRSSVFDVHPQCLFKTRPKQESYLQALLVSVIQFPPPQVAPPTFCPTLELHFNDFLLKLNLNLGPLNCCHYTSSMTLQAQNQLKITSPSSLSSLIHVSHSPCTVSPGHVLVAGWGHISELLVSLNQLTILSSRPKPSIELQSHAF